MVVAIEEPIDHQHLVMIGREAQRGQELRSHTVAARHTHSQNLRHAHVTGGKVPAQGVWHTFSLSVGGVATAFSIAEPERVPVKAQTGQQIMTRVPPRCRYGQTV